MSSATSIDGDARVSATPGADGDAARPMHVRPPDAIRPWHFFVLMSLVAATAAVIMSRDSRPEHLVLISLTIGAAGAAAGALYRTLAPLVASDYRTDDAPLPDRTRAGLEREKFLVLRSIKELEFDRAMGKVSAKDFDEMAGRLRGRAMSLMRQLDEGSSGYRELIERELSARLRVAKPMAGAAGDSDDRQRAREQRTSEPRTGEICSCGTPNDPDAVFCKRCGTKIEAPGRA